MARLSSLSDFRSLPLLALAIVVLGSLGSPAPTEAQTTVTITNPTTACVASIKKFYFPSGPPATAKGVFKYLTAPRNCVPAGTVSAACGANPSTAAAGDLTAQVTGTQLSGSPSCQWNCTGGCGTITIDTTDGLPVELMDFEVVDGDEAEDAWEDATDTETDGR